MERALLLLAFAIGGGVWLCGTLTAHHSARSGPPQPARMWIVTALLLPVLIFLATLPDHPPFFAPGHGLGSGFLIGGLLGWAAVQSVVRALGAARNGEPVSAAGAVAGPIGLALMAAVIPPLWIRSNLVDALMGISIGWLCSILLAFRALRAEEDGRLVTAARTALALSAASAIGFCSLMAMGELRGTVLLPAAAGAPPHWDAPAAAFAGCLVTLLLVLLLPAAMTMRLPMVSLLTGWAVRGREDDAARASARRGWRMALAAALMLIVGRLISARFAEIGDKALKTKSPLIKPLFVILGPSPLFHLICVSVAAMVLVYWLTRSHSRAEVGTGPHASSGNFVAAAFVTAAAAMLCFQRMEGFGMAMLLTALLVPAALACAECLSDLHERPAAADMDAAASGGDFARSAALTRLALFSLLLVLYRLFTVRYDSDLRGVGLTDHFALFGLLLGASAPPALKGFLTRVPAQARDTDGRRLLHLAVTGLLVLLLPTVLTAMWGTKAELALLIGLAISAVFEPTMLSALLAVAVALAVTQWTHHLLPLSQLTRDQKVNVIFWTTAAVAAALLISELGGRLRSTRGGSRAAARHSGGAR